MPASGEIFNFFDLLISLEVITAVYLIFSHQNFEKEITITQQLPKRHFQTSFASIAFSLLQSFFRFVATPLNETSQKMEMLWNCFATFQIAVQQLLLLPANQITFRMITYLK